MTISAVLDAKDRYLDSMEIEQFLQKNKVIKKSKGELLDLLSTMKLNKEFEMSNSDDIQEFLITYLVDNKDTNKINIEGLNTEEKRVLYKLLSENHPLLKILRISDDSRVISFVFGGIKDINTELSKNDSDIIFDNFKDVLQKEFFGKNDMTCDVRFLGQDYKTMTFNLTQDQFKKLENIDLDTKIVLIDKLIEQLERKELLLDIAKNHTNTSLEDVREIILNNIDFGVANSDVDFDNIEDYNDDGSWKSNEQKIRYQMEKYYESMIMARGSLEEDKNNKLEIKDFDIGYILEKARGSEVLKDKILKKYDGRQFDFNGVKYNIVDRDDYGNKLISYNLIKYIRKYGDSNHGEKTLELIGTGSTEKFRDLAKSYIDSINNGFDYISPAIAKTNIKQALEIDRAFRKGELDSDYFKYTYKGALNERYFYEYVSGRKGVRGVIDIKDMGVLNLKTGTSIIQNILKTIGSGGKTKLDNIDYDSLGLSDYGKEVTRRFMLSVIQLKEKYPSIEFSLGGDEIKYFIPEGNYQIRQLQKDIDKVFRCNDLSYRMSYSVNKNSINENEMYNNLDVRAGCLCKYMENHIDGVRHMSYESFQESYDVDVPGPEARQFFQSFVNHLDKDVHLNMNDYSLDTSLLYSALDMNKILQTLLDSYMNNDLGDKISESIEIEDEVYTIDIVDRVGYIEVKVE